MKIISTNISQPRTIEFQGQTMQTGIYKEPVNHPLQLGTTDVEGDSVIDRRFHGGEEKACYLFSADQYPAWKELYPNLEWTNGMFGENLTVEGLDERKINIGEIYKIGTAKVQVVQPRQPCFKFGIRMEDQAALKTFIDTDHPGVYLAVLEPGQVAVGDTFQLIQEGEPDLTITQVFHMLYRPQTDKALVERAVNSKVIPEGIINQIFQKHSTLLNS